MRGLPGQRLEPAADFQAFPVGVARFFELPQVARDIAHVVQGQTQVAQALRFVGAQGLELAAGFQRLPSKHFRQVRPLALHKLLHQLPGQGGRKRMAAVKAPGLPLRLPALHHRRQRTLAPQRSGWHRGGSPRFGAQARAFLAGQPGRNPVSGTAHRPEIRGDFHGAILKMAWQ